MSKSLIILAVGSILAAALSFIKLNQYRQQQRRKKNEQKQIQKQKQLKKSKSLKKQRKSQLKQSQKIQDFNLNLSISQNNQQQARQLYANQITEPHPYKIVLEKPILNEKIQKIFYNIILSLNKSKSYEGVCKIKIYSNPNRSTKAQDINLSLIGNLLYLSVNGNRIKQEDIQFSDHCIKIKKQWLKERERQNQIQVIFNNRYAFMGDGLICYFPLDQNNKYSLKGQVIYSKNSAYKVMKIFPCLNILNNCQILIQVLHPNGFTVQTNSHKMLTKIVSKKNYPLYPLLFQINNTGLNTSRSRRLNNSGTSDNSLKSEQQIVKARSQFSINKLTSIHDFFIFCSAVVEIRPHKSLGLARKNSSSIQLSKSNFMKQVLIRYFAKQHVVKKATSFLNILESQILQIFQKIEDYRKGNKKLSKLSGKIDIFFIDDVNSQGNFNQGSILLSQKTIQRGIVDRRLLFLLSRAIVGMHILIKKSRHIISLSQYLQLNQLVLQIFPQCIDFIYVKNKQYQNIQKQCIKIKQISQQNQDTNNLSYWVLEYYQKQCKYFISTLKLIQNKVSSNVKNIIDNLKNIQDQQQYWTYLIARYPFIQFNVSQILIKISIKQKGIPLSPLSLKYLKQNLLKSKYYLKFFTIKQIQKQLKKFIQLKCYNIQKYLPYIKIKQSYILSIPQQIQNYLSISQNLYDCIKIYQQFKKFNQENNYHHVCALKRQVKRIRVFLRSRQDAVQEQEQRYKQKDSNQKQGIFEQGNGNGNGNNDNSNKITIKKEQKDIQCGLQSWKMLSKLSIIPQNKQTRNIIQKLQKIKYGQQYDNKDKHKNKYNNNSNSNQQKYSKRIIKNKNNIQIHNVQQQQQQEQQQQQQQNKYYNSQDKRIQEQVRQIQRLLECANDDQK